ncbi:MAG: hypothetical protein IPH06_00445 [Alphaproteobacteria bacterium]|jgi:hypothetical protein|nr:hypothetical protein [Alphaproteobacteria bacterium]QQS56542.1 MAG: hypothetical protein IPN28_09695 [Alphaproteobacteria bacterium]
MPILDKASEEIFAIISAHFAVSEPNPLETITAALAAVAGEQLVRQIIPSGRIDSKTIWVFDEKVEDVLYRRERDTLNIIIGAGAVASGLPFERLPDMVEILERTDAAIRDSSSFPPLSIPREMYPAEWPPNCAFRHRSQIDYILDNNNLKGEGRVLACALAVSKMVKLNGEMTGDVWHFFILALEVLAGCSRMAPLKAEMESLW